MSSATDDIHIAAAKKISQLDTDSGLLILTDLVGSTPFNIATQLKEKQENALLVSGLKSTYAIKTIELQNTAIRQTCRKSHYRRTIWHR